MGGCAHSTAALRHIFAVQTGDIERRKTNSEEIFERSFKRPEDMLEYSSSESDIENVDSDCDSDCDSDSCSENDSYSESE